MRANFNYCHVCNQTTMWNDNYQCIACKIKEIEKAREDFLAIRRELSLEERLQRLESDVFEHIYKHGLI